MTLQELMRQIWENLGEPTDLDPEIDVSYQNGPLLRWVVNEGQRQVAGWKDPQSGAQLRMRNLFGSLYMPMKVVKGIFADEEELRTEEKISLFTEADDFIITGLQRFKGWILEIRGERRLIVEFDDDLIATVSQPFSFIPQVGEEFTLYKRFIYMVPETSELSADHLILPAQDFERQEGNLVDVLKIIDLQDQQALSKAPHGEAFVRGNTDVGTPRLWYRFGNRIVMDRAPQEKRWYEVEYYRMPSTLIGEEQESELPEQFHYGIVLWGTEWGLRRARETDEKYSTKRDFLDFMRSVKSQYEIEYERDGDYGSLGGF